MVGKRVTRQRVVRKRVLRKRMLRNVGHSLADDRLSSRLLEDLIESPL